MIRLAQLQGPGGRRVAVVQEPLLCFWTDAIRCTDLARVCLAEKRSPAAVVSQPAREGAGTL